MADWAALEATAQQAQQVMLQLEGLLQTLEQDQRWRRRATAPEPVRSALLSFGPTVKRTQQDILLTKNILSHFRHAREVAQIAQRYASAEPEWTVATYQDTENNLSAFLAMAQQRTADLTEVMNALRSL